MKPIATRFDTLCRFLVLGIFSTCVGPALAMTVNYPDVPAAGDLITLTIDTSIGDTNTAPDIGSFPGAATITLTFADGTTQTMSGNDLTTALTSTGSTTFIVMGQAGQMELDLTGNFGVNAVNDLNLLDGVTGDQFNGGSVLYDPNLLDPETPSQIIDVPQGGVTVTPLPAALGPFAAAAWILYRRRTRV
ncbi:MAG: hypothetical protein HY749_08835 [Gammaproteobacteria bacterium]|nr:hypothetical protein [Gammaproteobacteria bacterium]MBI5616822.1 hypothetical protein [Gammaproteobacteria bacterium]